MVKFNNSLTLRSLTTEKLNSNLVNQICILKNDFWRFGVKSQMKWFKKNIYSKDIHNLLFLRNKLIGYTALRKRSCVLYNTKSKKNSINQYLLFDTILINKLYRGNGYSNLLMKFNLKKIVEKKRMSFLICEKNKLKFYKIWKWRKLKKKNFRLINHKSLKHGLVYNYKKILNNNSYLILFDFRN